MKVELGMDERKPEILFVPYIYIYAHLQNLQNKPKFVDFVDKGWAW